MASDKELADFLAGVERRAFKQAAYAVRDDDASLDIVQDAMIKLAEKYGDRPAAELPLLFQRILQNAIHDWFRRQKVRNTWVTLFSSLNSTDDEDFDPLETLESADDNAGVESSEHRLPSPPAHAPPPAGRAGPPSRSPASTSAAGSASSRPTARS